jgi:hypothetical protein
MGIKTLLPFLREVKRKANLEEFKGQLLQWMLRVCCIERYQ